MPLEVAALYTLWKIQNAAKKATGNFALLTKNNISFQERTTLTDMKQVPAFKFTTICKKNMCQYVDSTRMN